MTTSEAEARRIERIDYIVRTLNGGKLPVWHVERGLATRQLLYTVEPYDGTPETALSMVRRKAELGFPQLSTYFRDVYLRLDEDGAKAIIERCPEFYQGHFLWRIYDGARL